MLIKLEIEYDRRLHHIFYKDINVSEVSTFSGTLYEPELGLFIATTVLDMDTFTNIFIIVCRLKEKNHTGVTHIFTDKKRAFDYLYQNNDAHSNFYYLKELEYDANRNKFVPHESYYKICRYRDNTDIITKSLYNYYDEHVQWPRETKVSIFDLYPNLVTELGNRYGDDKLNQIQEFFDRL